MTDRRDYEVHSRKTPTDHTGIRYTNLTATEAAIKYVEFETRDSDRFNKIFDCSCPMSYTEVAWILGRSLVFRVHVLDRPQYSSPTFHGVGNFTNAQNYLAEFKEDVPNLADQVRIEYQPIPEWTPLV